MAMAVTVAMARSGAVAVLKSPVAQWLFNTADSAIAISYKPISFECMGEKVLIVGDPTNFWSCQ